MNIGRFTIRSYVAETFKLDGGLMFGVVPKTLWSRFYPADANNLITMVNNIFVLHADDKLCLFDAGLGDTLSDREKKIYGTDGSTSIESGLRNLGLSVSDIDLVILSHLHSDHCAGAVKSVDNKYVPRFPKARYVIAKTEWEAALHPDERTSAVYIPERLHALEKAGVVDLIEPDCVILPGVRAVFTGGHSVGHYGIEISSEGQSVAYYADMFPSVHHMRVAFVPATDVLPLQTMEFKRKVLPRIIDENILLAFDHDTTTAFGRLSLHDGKYVVTPVGDIAGATVSVKVGG